MTLAASVAARAKALSIDQIGHEHCCGTFSTAYSGELRWAEHRIYPYLLRNLAMSRTVPSRSVKYEAVSSLGRKRAGGGVGAEVLALGRADCELAIGGGGGAAVVG
jgi:hypothetical protein